MKTRRQAVALLTGIIIAVALSMVPVAMLWADSPKASVPPSRSIADVQSSYGHLPLSFEANQGQTDRQVKFLSRGQGYNLFLTSTEAVLALANQDRALVKASEVEDSRSSKETRQAVLRMGLVGANPAPTISGLDALPGKANYFIGNDPRHWRTNVPTYVKVQYRDVYPGVDLVFYGNQRQLEYDFIVAPGVDPTAITLGFQGVERVEPTAEGDLVLHFESGDVRLSKPLIYQTANGGRREVSGVYVIKDRGQIGFQVGSYDTSRPLIIDPTLFYSTYLGGSNFDEGRAIAVDAAGNAYVTGYSDSINFPTTTGAFQTIFSGTRDAFVTKLNPSGSGVIYSSYLGGNGADEGNSIAVDAFENAYITGTTFSTNFPTQNAVQPIIGGGSAQFGRSDAFVTKLNSTGSALSFSTYLGGTFAEKGIGISIDTSVSAYVTGTTVSGDFPTVMAYQPTKGGSGGDQDVFATKLSPLGNALVYSTFLGGSADDGSSAIAVDSSGSAYVAGVTASSNFPVTAGAFQTSYLGVGDGFVTKFDPAGSSLVYSTYLGGSANDFATAIAVDTTGNAYLTGSTSSTNFPVVNALQPTSTGPQDAFVTKLNQNGSPLYSTYLGGTSSDRGVGIAVDLTRNTYVTGFTFSSDFPVMNSLSPFAGTLDVFVTKLNPAGTGFVYSTFLGGNGGDQGFGIAVDSFAHALVTGFTDSINFPTTTGAFQMTSAGSRDAFVTKIIDVTLPQTTTGGSAPLLRTPS